MGNADLISASVDALDMTVMLNVCHVTCIDQFCREVWCQDCSVGGPFGIASKRIAKVN